MTDSKEFPLPPALSFALGDTIGYQVYHRHAHPRSSMTLLAEFPVAEFGSPVDAREALWEFIEKHQRENADAWSYWVVTLDWTDGTEGPAMLRALQNDTGRES